MREWIGRAEQRWLALLVGTAVIHLGLSVCFPQADWATAVGTGLFCLIGGLLALSEMRRDPPRASQHGLLAIMFLLWLLAFASIGWIDLVSRADPSHALIDSLFLMARGAPLCLLLVGDVDAPIPRLRWLGALQAVLFVALAGALLFPAVASGSVEAPLVPDFVAVSYRDIENVTLALLSLIAWWWQPRCADRRFIGRVALLWCSYVAVAYALNRLLLDRQASLTGSLWLVIGDVPIMLFMLATLRDRRRPGEDEAAARLLPRAAEFARILAPSLLAVANLTMAMVLARTLFWTALAGGLASLLLFAIRSVLLQLGLAQVNDELVTARDDMARLARVDQLTGLPNRRAFEDALAHAWRRSLAEAQPIALILFDLDYFKQVNDYRGHTAGDDCLRQVAQILQQYVRSGDVLARYGGEEFALVALGADLHTADALAERLRRAVEMARIFHPTSVHKVVTISAGVTVSAAVRGGTTTDLLRRADLALYAAKKAGRNQVASSTARAESR